MRIVYLGWTGPLMDELSAGLRQFDPDMLYYIIGHNLPDRYDWALFNTRKNVKQFVDRETLFRDLAEFDVIVYDTYIFSKDDQPDKIIPLIPGEGCPTQWPEWWNLKATTILFDGESMAGKSEWYYKNMKFFDHIVTCNPQMPGFYTYYGVDEKVYTNYGSNNLIKALYTGDCLRSHYRAELYDLISKDSNNVCLEKKTDHRNWIDALNLSKMYLATYSCASGEKNPMCLKHKDAKALLCGALPLTEEFEDADRFLIPGKERITFKNLSDLQNKINYFDNHEDERRAIVEAGKKKVLSELTNDKMWQRAFENFKLI